MDVWFSEREGKHNSFSMVDLPGKAPVYVLNFKPVVMCVRHACGNFRLGDNYIEKVFLLSFFVRHPPYQIHQFILIYGV